METGSLFFGLPIFLCDCLYLRINALIAVYTHLGSAYASKIVFIRHLGCLYTIVSSNKKTKMTYYEQEINRIRDTFYSNNEQIETVIGIRNYIDSNYDADLSLNLLSHIRFVSKYHLLRLFKRHYGLTPKQYLMDKRIEKSKERLKSGMSVTETCFSVGFESLGSFSTLFKIKTGKSPSEFQKEQLSRSMLNF